MKQDDLKYYHKRYGPIMQMVKLWLVENPSNSKELLEAGVKIWKATCFPLRFISDKMDIDITILVNAVNEKILEWKRNGNVPKTDVLGDVFQRYFPELCCIRYTMEEIYRMKCWESEEGPNYFMLCGLAKSWNNRTREIIKPGKPKKLPANDNVDQVVKDRSDAKKYGKIEKSTMNNKLRAHRFISVLPTRNPEICIGDII